MPRPPLFPTVKSLQVAAQSLAPDVGCKVIPGSKGGFETLVPLLTNFLGKWVETLTEGMLLLGSDVLRIRKCHGKWGMVLH